MERNGLHRSSIHSILEGGVSYFNQIHYNTLDEKGRIVIPAVFRHDATPEILAGDFRITPDPNGYLTVRPESEWLTYLEYIQGLNWIIGKKRRFLRGLHALSQKTSLDRQNRLVLSPQMRKALGLEDNHGSVEMAIIGAGTYFELYLSETFEGEESLLDQVSALRDEVEGIDGEGFSG